MKINLSQAIRYYNEGRRDIEVKIKGSSTCYESLALNTQKQS